MTPIIVDKMTNEEVTSITIKEAQNHLSEIIAQIQTDDIPVIITHEGEEKAVIISLEAFAFLERIIAEKEDEIDRKALYKAKQDLEPTTSLDELKKN